MIFACVIICVDSLNVYSQDRMVWFYTWASSQKSMHADVTAAGAGWQSCLHVNNIHQSAEDM